MAGLITNRTVADGLKQLKGQQVVMQDGSVRIRLPIPDRALSPNARTHWAVKAKAVKASRQAAYAASANAQVKFNRPCISVTVYAKTKRRRDRDNIISALKSVCDGLADAGLFDNDSLVRWGDIEFGASPDDPHIVLCIKELPA